MAFASREKRSNQAVRRMASRDLHKQTERRRKKARKTQELQAFLSSNPYTRQLYAWYRKEKDKRADAPLLLVTFMLLAIGLIALLSASYPKAYYSSSTGPFYYFIRQAMFAAVGLVLMYLVSCFPYWKYKPWALHLYVLSVILLIVVLTPLGKSLNNAQRWLFGFQPSEIAKLAVMILFAKLAAKNPKSVHRIKDLAFYALLIAVLIGLLALEPHMSAAMIITIVAFSILFVAGMRVWFLLPLSAAGAVIAVIAFFNMEHVNTRFKVFLDPFSDARGKGYQIVQSLIAIGSGGPFGLGLGQSRQKFLYLPEPFNDFIFSVVCEELGFIGATLILGLFAFFIYRGFSIAKRAGSRFGAYLATGITMQFAFQILLNLAVVTGLFPVTGASLPLFSYGGTALVMQLLEIGILLNISRNIPPSKKQ